MISCDECRESLTAWLDGELPARTCTQLEEHLGSCSGCRQTLELHHREREWLKKSEMKLTPPPELWTRIEDTIRNSLQADSVAGARWHLLSDLTASISGLFHQKTWAGVAVALLMAFATFLVYQQRTLSPDDLSVQRMMDQYIQLRESQETVSHPTVPHPLSNVNELKSNNPFLEEVQLNPDQNPFEI